MEKKRNPNLLKSWRTINYYSKLINNNNDPVTASAIKRFLMNFKAELVLSDLNASDLSSVCKGQVQLWPGLGIPSTESFWIPMREDVGARTLWP